MASHLETSLKRDLDLIRGKVLEMSARAEDALRDCLLALREHSLEKAYSVIIRDQNIDELETEIDRLCLEFLVRQQPVAQHLRFVYVTIKINLELERVGDYAESIARQILKIQSIARQPFFEKFVEIADLSTNMLRDAAHAYAEQNVQLAKNSIETEIKVDHLRNEIDAELLKAYQAGKILLEDLTPLMTISRRFERVADQARSICEEVIYICTGQNQKHQGAEVIRVVFVDEYNSCRSQMAEGVAQSLNDAHLRFSSAGINPKPIDARTVDFLKQRGIDISRHYSKSVEQIPNFDHYHVIVALAKEAQKVFPFPPTSAVCLDWNVRDPSTVQGSPQEIAAAYEATYKFICSHIQDLTKAILGSKDQEGKYHNGK